MTSTKSTITSREADILRLHELDMEIGKIEEILHDLKTESRAIIERLEASVLPAVQTARDRAKITR